MSERDLASFREILLRQRREIFERLRQFESDWKMIGDREIELEEESQKRDITLLHDKLDAFETGQIEAIDLALYRIETGDYGNCENCRKPISLKRLEALPATRLCLKCARHYEKRQKKLPEAGEQIRQAGLPPEFKDFSDEELREVILEQLKFHGRVDLDELAISCKKGVIYLEGAVPSEKEHQIVLRVIREVMGVPSIIDYLDIDEVLWERERYASGRSDFPVSVDVENIAEDVFESQEEETPYMLPGQPPPEEE